MKAIKSLIEILLFIAIISLLCLGVYQVTGLEEKFNLQLTYWNWVGLVTIFVTLFPQSVKQSNLKKEDDSQGS